MEIQKLYRARITSSIYNINNVVTDILDKLKDRGQSFEDCIIFDSRVILNELISNAIKHGNKENINKSVKISTALIDKKYLLVEVEDEGDGFYYNCASRRNEDFQCEDDRLLMESGRGLVIVRCLCDKIKFNKKGNKIIVLKRLVKD